MGDARFFKCSGGAEQQSADRYECHSWSKSQTGFDPTRPEGGVPPEQNSAKREEYRRAMTACLEARRLQREVESCSARERRPVTLTGRAPPR
jgi:hypothetical protein